MVSGAGNRDDRRRQLSGSRSRAGAGPRGPRPTTTPETDHRLEHLLDPEPASAGLARLLLDDYVRSLGIPEAVVERVRLAVSEAVTNVILHAYSDGSRGVVELAAWALPQELWVLVADTGIGISARHPSSGLGLGLVVMKDAADALSVVERAERGTEVRMRFDIPSGHLPGAEGRA